VGDLLALVVQVDDEVGDAVAGEERDGVADERHVAYRQERLRPLVGQGNEPGGEAGGQNHRAGHGGTFSKTTKCRWERAPGAASKTLRGPIQAIVASGWPAAAMSSRHARRRACPIPLPRAAGAVPAGPNQPSPRLFPS